MEDISKAASILGKKGGSKTAEKGREYFQIIGSIGGKRKKKNSRKVIHKQAVATQ